MPGTFFLNLMKHTPRKRFGQHFLKDQIILEEIIKAISPRPTDLMVEIGPGLGALTNWLLYKIPLLHVIELDRDLAKRLKDNDTSGKLEVHQADALMFDFAQIPQTTDQKLRIVGNLPYNISTPLLFHLTQFIPLVKDQYFMLQKEVVERMVANPGTKAYSRLSVMLQWLYHMDLLFTVPPEAFNPPPKVMSAVVRMIPNRHPHVCDAANLEKTVTMAFSQRRKIMRNTMAPLFGESDLINAGIDPARRPEEISVEQFVALANQLPPAPDKKRD